TGLANATEFSGYEPLARMFYSDSVAVPRQCHAVDRSRYLLSSALDITPIKRTSIPQFYSESFVSDLSNQDLTPEIAKDLRLPYVLCFHATARAAKQWNIQGWIAVGKFLLERGLHPVFPWGSPHEKQISQLIVEGVGGGIVPPAYSIKQYFAITSHAKLTIGVDTGLTHLAAVLGRPTIEIYCDSPRWKTAPCASGCSSGSSPARPFRPGRLWFPTPPSLPERQYSPHKPTAPCWRQARTDPKMFTPSLSRHPPSREPYGWRQWHIRRCRAAGQAGQVTVTSP
ncbi:MAG: hypothetical protein EBV06_16980, partial [Planctomycetia bacterium]|nr:hypothetical protein [Planctomycetia bacterium]